jgi:PKD repeat protein
MTRSLRAALRSTLALALAAPLLGVVAAAQEPLFAFAQVSDSQPQTSAENQAFVDVLRTLAEAGTPGALLPRRVELVLFAGDITWGNTRSEWESATAKLDQWLTANDIPFLAVPGNHDVNNSDTALYEEYIADAGVWDAGSAAFVGHNQRARTTSWRGLRFIGFNNSNPGWNTVSSADLASITARVASAAAAAENVFLVAHHPHDEKERLPLVDVLPNPSAVAYMHGHSGAPHVTQGLAGIVNPNLWDVGSNAIYEDRALIYFEVFASELRAYVVILNQLPTALPAPKIVPLVHPLTLTSEPSAGFAGPLHVNARPDPTARTPERKLWFAAGAWWGVLWSDAVAAWRIQRLDPLAQAWIDTGPSVSSDAARSFEAALTGTTLVLASNVPTPGGAPGAGSPMLVQRFSYDAPTQAWQESAGFPAVLADARAETLVLARDGLGTLWAAWTQSGAVRVAHTLASEADWSAPLVLASGLAPEDSVALVAFAGEVGALWSSTPGGLLGFARHVDGDAPASWSFETPPALPNEVGATLDLAADGARVFAVVRATDGAVRVFARGNGGDWSVHAVSDALDGLAHPSLVVDHALGTLRVLASASTPAGRGAAGGGALYAKAAPLGTLAFPPGRGTPIALDGLHPSCGFATSARAPVDLASGLAVLGSVAETERYWCAFDDLAAPLGAPFAEFDGAPLSGSAPLVVAFRDLSSGGPTYWEWSFGDGGSSRERDPQHVYTTPGTYGVTLRVANGGGEDLRTRTAYVTVGAPPPVFTFLPVADARVSESSPSSNAGSDTTLRVKTQAGSSFQSFLRFDLGTLPGAVSSAKLRLWCTDSSPGGGSVYRISSNTWGESTINWSNKPALPANPLASFGGVTLGFWSELELGPAAVSNGLVSLALAGGTTNSAYYSSREGAEPPELVLTLAGSLPPPVASFSGTPLTGPAPLTVSFTDTSSGAPHAWAWDFGDGTSSSAQNPVHTYDQPGTYTVLLDVSNPSGFDSQTRLDYVVVSAPPPVRTYRPNADARVAEGSPTRNFGGEATLRVRTQAGGSGQSFLRFDLASLTGTVVSAKLRLFCSDGGTSGGRVHTVSSTWSETTLNWNNKPALLGSPLATLGAVALGSWIEIDVTSAVSGPGLVAFGIGGGNTNTILYASREGANPPELVIETGTAVPPTADFGATPLTGNAPLLVRFTDQSLGATSWAWDFGDGGSSSLRDPEHVYASPGTYTVTLTATNAVGSDTRVRTDLVSVGAPSPVQTFLPIADSRANEANPSSTAGTEPTLRVRQSPGASYHTYLRFDLTSLTGTVVSAKLRLYSTDGSNVAGLVYPTTGSWTEAGLNWSNKPPPSGALLASGGTVATDAWAEFDVTGAVSAGLLDLVLQSSSTNSCYYSSREGLNPPELVVTTSTP